MFSVPTFSGPVEFISSFSPRPQISHVVFDFDGTLSWLRHGWPDLMCTAFRPYLPVKSGESEADIRDLMLNEILSLNGKPFIFQVERFRELVRERGGTPPDAKILLEDYDQRLDAIIEERSTGIRSGKSSPGSYVIHQALPFLELLKNLGMRLVILSGTLQNRVKEEAEMLGLTRYFGSRIYGNLPAPAQFSKRLVLDRLLREEKIEGHHLLSFGDGPVEIQHTKELGGLAVAVASDEDDNGSGKMDSHKRQQLLKAGADVVIPDYRDAAALLNLILQR
jgi:phosphoglycolate phosphatase